MDEQKERAEQKPADIYHNERMGKIRELAKQCMCEPLSRSIQEIEYAGEELQFLADYCDRLRINYEEKQQTAQSDWDRAVLHGQYFKPMRDPDEYVQFNRADLAAYVAEIRSPAAQPVEALARVIKSVPAFNMNGYDDDDVRRLHDWAVSVVHLATKPVDALVAAAPDLLLALQGVLRVADRATVEFDAARAAIAKATAQPVEEAK